jgi:hypothetical protein
MVINLVNSFVIVALQGTVLLQIELNFLNQVLKSKEVSVPEKLPCDAVRPDLVSMPGPQPIWLGGPPMLTSEAGLAKGRPTQLPELLGVNGGVGLPGTGL